MDAIGAMLGRVTVSTLRDPAPSAADLDRIVAAGLAAPDHGRLRPWRFLTISGEAKQRFAAICLAALHARDPAATGHEAERMRGKLLAPPLIVVLGLHATESPKVPETEQVQAVAAAAVNMLNAAHALGYGGKWVTGPNAYDPSVAAALGLERVIGFLYLGTPDGPVPPAKRPSVADHLKVWA